MKEKESHTFASMLAEVADVFRCSGNQHQTRGANSWNPANCLLSL